MENHDNLSDDEVIISDKPCFGAAAFHSDPRITAPTFGLCSPTRSLNAIDKVSSHHHHHHNNNGSSSTCSSSTSTDYASILRSADYKMEQPKRALSSTRYEEWRRECDRAELDGHAKTVRFADSMGFDLEVTKLYTDEELPNIPPEAYYHLTLSSSRELTPPDPHEVTWTALFSQPYTTPYFHRNLLQNKVQLDHAFIHNMEISVTVRVVNLAFHKRVFLRYSQNAWHTWNEKETKHLRHIPQHNVDVFCVKAPLPELSLRVEFALRFECLNQQFWDNNGNLNYIFVQENRSGFNADKDVFR